MLGRFVKRHQGGVAPGCDKNQAAHCHDVDRIDRELAARIGTRARGEVRERRPGDRAVVNRAMRETCDSSGASQEGTSEVGSPTLEQEEVMSQTSGRAKRSVRDVVPITDELPLTRE